MKRLSYQRGRDLFLISVGTLVLTAEFVGWAITGQKPDSTICIGAIGLLGSPVFLKRDENK